MYRRGRCYNHSGDARYRLKAVKQLLEVWHDWRRVRAAGCPFIFVQVYLLLFLTIINNVIS